MLRKGQLRLGSNLFHYGVIIVILGHFAGFLAPHWAIDWALSPVAHQLLAMVVGGIAGARRDRRAHHSAHRGGSAIRASGSTVASGTSRSR